MVGGTYFDGHYVRVVEIKDCCIGLLAASLHECIYEMKASDSKNLDL